jgi:hypothetical protein
MFWKPLLFLYGLIFGRRVLQVPNVSSLNNESCHLDLRGGTSSTRCTCHRAPLESHDSDLVETGNTFIRYVGAGLSRTGTQSLARYFQLQNIYVYNQISVMQQSDLQIVRWAVPCMKHDDPAFLFMYDRILRAGKNLSGIATLDVPANFCYQQIIQHQLLQNISPADMTIVLSNRRGVPWLNSMQSLVQAFAPLNGWPYSLIFGDITTHTSRQFAYHLNCSICRSTFGGFVYDAWIENPDACLAGYHRWSEDVRRFAEQQGIEVMHVDLSDMTALNISHNSVTRNQLAVIYFVTRLPLLLVLLIGIYVVCWFINEIVCRADAVWTEMMQQQR